MSNASLIDIKKCRDESHELTEQEQIPVFGEDMLYKNMYCAKCNMVSGYQFKGITIICEYPPINPEDTVPEILARNRDTCTADADLNYEHSVLQCYPELCTQEYATFCRLFQANFYDVDTDSDQKNVYCHKCRSLGINGYVQDPIPRYGNNAWSKVCLLYTSPSPRDS